MRVVALKFVEVATRALFVVIATYSLPLDQAGQFGLFVTLQGFASFAFGYERHIDIQRRVVGASQEVFDSTVSRAFALFIANYIVFGPLFLVAVVMLVKATTVIAMCFIAVAIIEQLMNQGYQLAMVNARYQPYLVLASIKNVLLLAGLLLLSFTSQFEVSFENVVYLWTLTALATVIVAVIMWFVRMGEFTKTEFGLVHLRRQYRESLSHFGLGLVAITTLQFDRIVIGMLLPLASAGIYFRHILLVSLLYQVFNIAFFNTSVPKIFARARSESVGVLRATTQAVYWKVLLFLVAVVLFGFGANWITHGEFAERYYLSVYFLLALLCGSALRMRADLNGLLFNAFHFERRLLHLQMVAFLVGATLMVGLTWVGGIPGAIGAAFITSMLYCALTFWSLNRNFRTWGEHERTSQH